MEKKLETLPAETPVQRVRREISRQCRAAGELVGGIYRLDIPTGGGKTLSSLRYALNHAVRHQKTRIIFTAPLLNILEQNAAMLREFLQEDDLILEHHSNVVQEKSEQDQLDLYELMSESWDAPIIITTRKSLKSLLVSVRKKPKMMRWTGRKKSWARWRADIITVVFQTTGIPITI